MDRIIKSESSRHGDRFRLHHFSPIKQTPLKGPSTRFSSVYGNMEQTVWQPQDECPNLSQLESGVSGETFSGQQGSAAPLSSPSSHTKAIDIKQTLACTLKRFNEAIIKFEEERQAVNERAVAEIVKLALAIAQKILSHEITVSYDALFNVAQHAIQKVQGETQIHVKFNSHDLAGFKQAGLDPSCWGDEGRNVVYQADDSIARGDCVIETEQGTIDAGIDKQLAVIEEAFNTVMTHTVRRSSS